MTSRGAVVFGAGGLLGSAVSQELRSDGAGRTVVPATRLAWDRPDVFARQLDALDVPEVGAFVVHWCAGAGRVGARPEVLATETELLRRLVDFLRQRAQAHDTVRIVMASSAGAVWSGAGRFPVRASTAPAPAHAYGVAKLEQEAVIVDGLSSIATVEVARLSNLYGPGQRLDKPQGLLSHLVLNALRNQPTTIFVPLDTARDYVWTGDAARDMVALGDGTQDGDGPVRVVATGHTHTISAVVAVLRRLLRRRVPVTHAIRKESASQPRILSFVPDQQRVRATSLAVGLRRLVDLRAGMASGLS